MPNRRCLLWTVLLAVAALLLAHLARAADPSCPGRCPPCPTGELVARPIYTLCNDPTTKFARWVAYVVRPEDVGPTRRRTWRRDPDLPAADTLGPGAYRGAHRRLHVDRGHQAPLASFSGTRWWPLTDYLSNITPQASPLNEGPWAALEQAVRDASLAGPLEVITGPLYDGRSIGRLPAAPLARVPTGYWKAVCRGRDCDGFLFEQQTPRHDDFCSHATPLHQVEQRADLHLLSRVQGVSRRTLDRSRGSILDRLGCGR